MGYIFFESFNKFQCKTLINLFQKLWDSIIKLFRQQPLILKYPEYQQILNELRTVNALEVANRHPKLLFALYRDNVIDLTKIIHSAGCFMNYQVRGREISRFINGSFDLETYSEKSQHQHSKFVLQQIKRQTVGKIDTSHLNLIRKSQKYAQFEQSIHDEQFEESIWKLIKVTNISNDLVKIEFRSNTHLVLNTLPGVNWLGRHIAITPSESQYKERIYTTVIFSTENNTKIRDQLLLNFDKKLTNQQILDDKYEIEQVSPTYPILVKKYSGKNPLSTFMCQAENQDFIFYGPFGQGFGFTKESNKTYYFILGGTTVPILDLTDFLLKKAIYQVIKQNYGASEAQKFNPYNQDFDNIFGKNFKIVLLLSIKNINEFLGLELCSKLLEISKKYQLNIFDIVFRFSKQKIVRKQNENQPLNNIFEYAQIREERFDEKFLQKNIDSDELGKIFLSGPHQFVYNMHSFLSARFQRSQLAII